MDLQSCNRIQYWFSDSNKIILEAKKNITEAIELQRPSHNSKSQQKEAQIGVYIQK